MSKQIKNAVQESPHGTRPIMLSSREMESFGLKTGKGLRDTVSHKILNRADILSLISSFGVLSPFHAFKADLANLEGNELLLIADPVERYGENWIICLTKESIQSQLNLITTSSTSEEQQEHTDNSIDVVDLPAEAYQDKPLISKSWKSTSLAESFEQVEAQTVHNTRPVIKLSLTKLSDELNQAYKFNDRHADQCLPLSEVYIAQLTAAILGFIEFRPHKDSNYELLRREQDLGLRGIPLSVDGHTQTSWFRSVNSIVQYESTAFAGQQKEVDIRSLKILQFLERVIPLVEEALQQNETFDIFCDSFSYLREEDSTVADRNENSIIEIRSFTDLIYSKNKTIGAVDWHPKKNGIIAAAATSNVETSKRLLNADNIGSSYILIWNFIDLIHPQLILEASQDIQTFRYNVTQPHIIAAGLYSGQIAIWDTTYADPVLAETRSGVSTSPNKDTYEAKKQVSTVKPLHISSIDASHRCPVTDLCWLGQGQEVSNRGHILTPEDKKVHQFATIAADGQLCFWDLRFKDPKYRGSHRSRADKRAIKDMPEVQFIPLYCITLTKLESVGEIGLRCLSFENPAIDTPDKTIRSRLYCATEEGELLYVDWRPHSSHKQAGNSRSNRDEGDTTATDDTAEYIQWINNDHYSATISLSASPFFTNIYLTASEANFHIWNIEQAKDKEVQAPLFVSPVSSSSITCAKFSPSRPAVIFIGKADGILEVWDLIDQSHRVSLTATITACALTSMEFRTSSGLGIATASTTRGSSGGPGDAKATHGGAIVPGITQVAPRQQILAIGNQCGNLHVLEIPKTLSRAASGEKKALEEFFRRETDRLQAVGGQRKKLSHKFKSNPGATDGSKSCTDGVDSSSAPGLLRNEEFDVEYETLQSEVSYKQLEIDFKSD